MKLCIALDWDKGDASVHSCALLLGGDTLGCVSVLIMHVWWSCSDITSFTPGELESQPFTAPDFAFSNPACHMED